MKEPEDSGRSSHTSDAAWSRIVDYVAGRASTDERAALEEAAARDEALRAAIEEARLAWERSARVLHTTVDSATVDRAWSRLEQAMRASGAERPAAPRVIPFRDRLPRTARHPRRSWRRIAALAAVAMLAIALGVTWTLSRNRGAAPVAMEQLATAAGERLPLTLEDGTEIVLAPGSRLAVPVHFTGDTREVTLTGRAYFHVRHDATRPFLVHARGVETRVLGTEFSVDAYPGDGTVEVMVRSGGVAVRRVSSDARDGVVLTRGQRALVDSAGPVRVESGVDTDARLSWTSGRLVFDRAPLSEVLTEVEHWYGLTVELRDPALGSRRLTATFQRESPDAVMQIIATLVDARVARSGSTIILAPRQ